MFPRRGLHNLALAAVLLIMSTSGCFAATASPKDKSNIDTKPKTDTAAKSQLEGLAKEAVTKFGNAVRAANASRTNKESANIELKAVVEMTETIKQLQVITEKEPSLSSMAIMQGVIGLQSALVNYAIYDITLDEDILATGRRSAENALKLLAASIQLSKEEQGELPKGKNEL